MKSEFSPHQIPHLNTHTFNSSLLLDLVGRRVSGKGDGVKELLALLQIHLFRSPYHKIIFSLKYLITLVKTLDIVQIAVF